MGLVDVLQTESCGTDAFSVRFSPDGDFLAASGAQGQVSVFNVSTGKEGYRLNISEMERHPVKQVCWRPEQSGASLRTRGVLVGASTDGKLRQWHVGSAKLLQTWGDPEDTGQFLCVDYAPDGKHLAAAGLRGEIHVFDEERRATSCTLRGGDGLTTPGHSSRVFAVRYPQVPGPSNLIFSGGWDNTVQFWDVRVGHAVRAIFGPSICGDALDIDAKGTTLLTGSYRESDQLELWDIGTGNRLEALPWRTPPRRRDTSVYCARFSRDAGSSKIAAGGCLPVTGCGEARVLARGSSQSKGSANKGLRCLGTLRGNVCLSIDFSPADDKLVAFGGHDGRVRVMRLDDSVPNPQDDDASSHQDDMTFWGTARTDQQDVISDGESGAEDQGDEEVEYEEEMQTTVTPFGGLAAFGGY